MSKKHIKFNIPYNSKFSKKNILKVFKNNKFADGEFQKKCKLFIEQKINSKCVELTHSCSSALEIAMLLIDLKKNDEVIMPSYTFTSTANAVLLRGAKPVFVDVRSDDINLDPKLVEKKINKKTKAIIVVHYAGVSCDMNYFLKLKKKYNIYLIEDAAHAFLGKYNEKYLGTIGDFGAFSFHETKNFVGGQCGALSINNLKFHKKAKIILDKGTDRSLVKNKKKYYSWKGIGSEYRATELSSALLFGQLIKCNYIQKAREKIWNKYFNKFYKINDKNFYILNKSNKFKISAHHVFALIFKSLSIRNRFILYMKKKGIDCFFHYYPLHMSNFGKKLKKIKLPVTEKIYYGLVRLPLHPSLNASEVNKVIKIAEKFIRSI